MAQISSAVAVLAAILGAMRDLEADLGRLSGRLSHLFTLNYARASLRRVQLEIATVSAAVVEPRTEIATVMRAISRKLE